MGLQRPGFLNVETLQYGVDNMIRVRVNTQRVGIRLHSSACDPLDLLVTPASLAKLHPSMILNVINVRHETHA